MESRLRQLFPNRGTMIGRSNVRRCGGSATAAAAIETRVEAMRALGLLGVCRAVVAALALRALITWIGCCAQ
jgi:hypothetical protein